MSLNESRATFATRQSGARFVIVAAAIVFASLAIAGALAVVYAILGFCVMAAAALLTVHAGEQRNRLAQPVAARTVDPLAAVVAGLPDPVIALDRDGRVLALNEPARSLAPALRQGEPVSLSLR